MEMLCKSSTLFHLHWKGNSVCMLSKITFFSECFHSKVSWFIIWHLWTMESALCTLHNHSHLSSDLAALYICEISTLQTNVENASQIKLKGYNHPESPLGKACACPIPVFLALHPMDNFSTWTGKKQWQVSPFVCGENRRAIWSPFSRSTLT